MISSTKIGILGLIITIGYYALALNNYFDILKIGYLGVMLIPILIITTTCSLIALQNKSRKLFF
tara:strand:+ start:59 stop:250 length:192 start_codon:yes stop_codon:yes gene_type:complete